jgi:hypothetical protein
MDEFFQSDDWKTADSPTRHKHLERITGVFDEEYSRAAPELNPDEADQLFNSGVSFLKGRLAESGDAPTLDAFPSEDALKAADALRQTRNDANAPEPNAEDYGRYGLEAIQLKKSSAQERYPKERLDFIKKTGLRPEHVDRLMDDREALERLKDNAVVMKTTGDVAVPPQKAMDEAEWNSAVDATNATPEKKAKAKAHRLKVRDQLAGKIEFSLAAVDPEWEKWSAGMAGEMKNASIGEKVERFIKWRKASGAKMSAIDRAVDQNAASFVKQFFGLIGGITNIGKMKEAAATAGEIEQANAQIRSVMGGAGATGFAVDLFGGLAPTIAFSPLARLATTNLGALRLMGVTAAAQGYGGKYADASAAYSEQGLSDQDAHMKAQLPALVSAATTYILARMMPGGVESIAQIGRAKDALKTATRKWGGELFADIKDETFEEIWQGISDEITAKFTYDPSKDMKTAVSNVVYGGLMGAVGGGVVGAATRYANKVKPILETADQMRAAGYPLAAAETEKTAEIAATEQYWQDVAKAQKRAAEHTQANEGPLTERAAYGRTGDVYDAFGNVQRKPPANDGGPGVTFQGQPLARAQSDAGLVSAEGAQDAKTPLYDVFGNVQRKVGEPKNEKAQSVPSLQAPAQDVRLPEAEVAPAAPPPEPVTPAAAKPLHSTSKLSIVGKVNGLSEQEIHDAILSSVEEGGMIQGLKDGADKRGHYVVIPGEPGLDEGATAIGPFVDRDSAQAFLDSDVGAQGARVVEAKGAPTRYELPPPTPQAPAAAKPVEQAIADAVSELNWRGTVREVPAPRSMGGESVKLYIPVDASGKDVTVGGQTILGKTPAEAIELAQKNTKPTPTPQAPAPVKAVAPDSTGPVEIESSPKAEVISGTSKDIGAADMQLGVSPAQNHFTLWMKQKQPDGRWGRWNYISILGKNRDQANARALEAANRIASGDLTGIAFLGKEKITVPKIVGVLSDQVSDKELMGIDRVSVGEQNVGFGKYSDVQVKELFRKDPNYAMWLVGSASGKRGQQIADYISNQPDFIVSRDAAISAGRDAVNDEAIATLSKHNLTAEPQQDGSIIVGGKTYDWKDTIKQFGGRFDGNSTGWRLQHDQFKSFLGKLEGVAPAMGGQRGGLPAYTTNPVLGKLRADAEARPDRSGIEGSVQRYISDDTAALIHRGSKFGMPKDVLDEQVEDVARINRAYQDGKGMFLLASQPGSGKTFVLGAAIRELRKSGAKKIYYVTLREELIQQIQNDLAAYGIGDVEFITYPKMRTGAPQASDVIIFDEAHAIKNVGQGDETVQQAEAARKWIAKSKFTLLSTATPFENPVQAAYLEPTGIFDPVGGHEQFAMAFGATKMKFKDGSEILIWKRGSTSDIDQAAARDYLQKEGVFTSRKIRLPESMVDSRLVKVQADKGIAEMYAAFSEAAAENENSLTGFAPAWIVNFQKRLLEAGKVRQGIEEAESALKRGRSPIIFVETKAERKIDIPDLIEREQEWKRACNQALADRDKPPARAAYGLPPRGITEVMESFMAKTGIKIVEIPSAEDLIVNHFGKDKVAIFTGSVTPKKAQDNLARWRGAKDIVLVATMAKGGTGLSLHDKDGNHPTTQININLPWSATGVVQVAQRSARYGLASKAEMQWLFAENIPFDRTLGSRVGGRMADMGAVVHGEKLSGAAEIENWDFESKSFRESNSEAQAEPKPAPTVAPSPAAPQAEGGIFGYSWADIRGKQQGGTLAALIRGNAPKATESDFAVLEKHGMDWLYDNKKGGIIDRLGLPAERPSKKAVGAKPPAQSFTEKVRAKIVPGAKVSVQLVRGAKLAHPAIVRDVFLDSKGKPESVSVTFDGGKKKGITQTVPYGNVSLRPGVESRMLTNEQFEGMTKEEARKTRAAAVEFKKLVIEYPELGFYSGHLEAVAAGPQGEAAIKKARADAYVKAMMALGVHPDKADARDAVTQASLVEKMRELTKKPIMERKQYADFQEAKGEGDGEIKAGDLKYGETINIGGEEMRVIDIDRDGVVTLQDGEKFGTQEVHPDESLMIKGEAPKPVASKPTTYINGDKAEYTGETREIAGGTFYVVKFLEGNREGTEGVTQRRPDGTSPDDGRAQAEWQQQQADARKIAAAEELARAKVHLSNLENRMAYDRKRGITNPEDVKRRGELQQRITELEKPAEPATPKLRPSDGKGTGELLQGDAAPFNLVAETAADIAKREEREAAEQVAKEAKDAAEAKAKQDKEQGNLFDEDPFAIADSAPATSLPVASVQRAVRVVAERLAGAMPHEVIADGSAFPDRVKEVFLERYGSSGDLNRIRGAVVDGKIWINAAAIENPRQAIETFMHEAAGHGGVDALLQAFGEKATAQLDAMLKRLFPDEHAAVKRSYPSREQVSETLAKIMEGVGPEMSAQHRTRWQRVVDWLRNALNKLGVKQWSTNDVMALLRRGVDAVRKQRARAADVRARVSEARGDGPKMSYAGEKAQVPQFMRDSLDTAKAMAAAGKTSEEIRAVTGWFPGKYDGKMRWEVPDDGAILKDTPEVVRLREEAKEASARFEEVKAEGKGFSPAFNEAQVRMTNAQDKLRRAASSGDLSTIGERLEHPSLFDAYPAAKRIRLVLKPMQPNYGGYFDPISNKIAINSIHSKEAQVSSLLHELQHWVQKQENFSEGGDLSQFLYSDDFKLSAGDQATVDGIDAQIADLRKEERDLGEFFRSLPDSMKGVGKTEKESRRLNDISYQIRDLNDKRYAITKPARNRAAADKYRRTAGEIESRDVQARQNFTPEQRKAVEPYSSENIAKEDAIVMRGDGPKMSADNEQSKPFYSALTKTVQGLPQETMTVQQAAGMLGEYQVHKTTVLPDGKKKVEVLGKFNPLDKAKATALATQKGGEVKWASQKGVKEDEVNMAGILTDPLSPLAGKQPGDKVTKSELTGYALERQATVQDVVLGQPNVEDEARRDAILERYKDLTDAIVANRTRREEGEITLEESRENARVLTSERSALDDEINAINKRREDTHFSRYQLPGADEGSYREMFVTWPEQDKAAFQAANLEWRNAVKAAPDYADTPEVLAADAKRKALREKMRGWNDGHSQYSDIANPIVRIRRNIRTDAEGRKTYFIEEMQGPGKGEQEKMPPELRKRIYEIGMKRALRDAVDEGADAIAWTTGEQQVERYPGVEKQIDKIEYVKNPDGTFYVNAVKGSQPYLMGYSLPAEKLEDSVGKEIAAKIINGEGKQGAETTSLSGLDLKVGGKGLKRVYDQMLPAIANDLAKKFGVKAGRAEIPNKTGGGWMKQAGIRAVELSDGTFGIRDSKGFPNGPEFATRQQAETYIETDAGERTLSAVHSLPIPEALKTQQRGGNVLFSLKGENPEATSTTKKAVMDKEREVAMLQGSADKLLQDIRKSGRPPTVEEMQQIAAIDSLIAKRQAEIQAEASNVAQGATPPEINIADMNAEPPDREETGESGPRTYGGKFDSMDAQRAERGLPPLARRFRKANRVLWDAAVKRFETEPKWADRLVDEISSGEKTVLTDEEFAGVFAQQIDLHNKRQEAADRARDPNLSEEEQRDALDQFQYYEKKLQASEILKGMAGSEAGAALQSLKLMANEDFSLAAMEARERKAKQSGLTPEEVDRIRDEATRIAKAQADLDARKAATEAAERIANAEAKIAEWSKIPSRVLEYAKQKLSELVSAGNAAGERLRARAGQVNVGVDPTILGDIFLFARGKIAQGIESFGNFAASTASEFGEWVSPYLKPAWDKAMKYFNANQPERKVSSKQKARQQAATEAAASIEDGIRAMAEEGLPDDMGRYVKQLANEYVKSGATTVKGVMARLHAFLDPVMGNPTDDVLLDLWTDYGKGKAATEDALKRLQSQIRQEALLVRQIIDAEAALVRSQAGEDVGDYLKLTGQQRVPVRDQARALAQQLNELKKKIPPPQGTAESRRQSALDALEKRTRNRIKDLRFEIAKGERTIKNRGVTPTSPNLEALRAELATVKAEHLAVFGRREATPEQKLKSAIKSAERAEQKALAELEAAKRGVFTRPVQKGAETRNEVLVIRARADAARAETQALKELANPPLSDAQKRLDAALVARERWEQMLAGEQQPTSRQPQESLTQLEEDARMEIAAMRELAAQIRRDAKPATDPDDAKVRALEAAAAEYERRVNESDFTAKSKTTTADSARVAQARALRDAALAAYNAAKNAAGVTEQTKLANRKAAMLRQIADLTDRLAKSDFEKRPPRPPVDLSKDPEAVRIASDLQEIKSNYAKRLLHYIKERRGGYEKFTDALWTAFTAERSLMGSGDLSAPRQAVRMVKAHPIMAAKAMWRSIRTIFSQKQAVSYEAERKLRPNYALYKPMKIQMPSVEAEAHDRMAEEGVRSNIEDWADIKLSGNPLLVLPKLVPKLLGHYVRASSRTFTTFLNELAADVADYRINELRDKPMSKIEKEALGDMINSGRGRGLKAGAGKLAQFVFYSANFLAARAKNLSGYHVWRRNSSMRIRKIALKEQFRAIAGWMVVSAISRYFYGDTGDDEDMFDKAKRLFKMKVTDSDARMEYDYTGGEVKLARIGAALIEGISTTIQSIQSGQEEADKQRAFKSYATIGHTLRDISAPWVGVATDLFTGSNYDGKVPTVTSIARDLTVPLAWRSADEFFERAGFAKTVGAKLQEAIGVGVSVTRDKTAPKERRYSR